MATFKEFFTSSKNRFFWVNLLAMFIVLIATGYGTLYWLDQYTHHGESFTVPNVLGKDISQASILFEKNQMTGAIVDSNYVKGQPAGVILDQTPAGGSKVKRGRTIYLTVNTDHVPRVALPDIVENSSYRQAEGKLKAMGFKLTEPEYIPGEKDWVYDIKFRGQSLTAGDLVPRESLLTLCIGDGHTERMDSLVNDSLMQASPTESDTEATIDESWF